MELTVRQRQQRRFFDDFGYIHLPGLFAEDIAWITEEFERLFREEGVQHDGSKRSSIGYLIERSESLCALLDHPDFVNMLTATLGPDYNFMGSSGDLYVGDGMWHPDGVFPGLRFAKVAMYLDPLTPETGSLRIIPGSHRGGWIGNQDTRERWGIDPLDVPCVAPVNTPGDVFMFNLNTVHSSLNGSNRRRAINMGFSSACASDQEREELKRHVPAARSELGWETLLRTAPPERMKHLNQVLELTDQNAR